MDNKQMTTKIFPSFTKSMDAETGIVEAYVSLMGIKDLDSPPDVIQMGAFAKTIQERGPQGARKIRVLHQHKWDRVIGTPLTLVEHTRDMLPPELLALYPEATGGLFARTQFVMDVQLGRETYALYKAGAMDEWSIGFDTLQFEYLKSEEEDTYRILKELKLWEYSPVTWGMNPATVTTAVKADSSKLIADSKEEDDDETNSDGGAEPHEDALTPTREMAMKLKQLEIDLAMARLRRLK
ncbi:MAG: HK97 family phage prohead protease [Anaerovoracaceae bacterium]|jgi:HK97 family phage prohead protease